jgi:hypothetical protein
MEHIYSELKEYFERLPARQKSEDESRRKLEERVVNAVAAKIDG